VCDGFRPPADHPNAATDYDTSTAGIVVDRVSGLTWESSPSARMGGTPCPAATCSTALSATSYCAQGAFGGLSGWRVPTLLELESIVDFGVRNPAIATQAFPATPSSWFWTGTGIVAGPPDTRPVAYWTIDFASGVTLNGSPNTSNGVRCVKPVASPSCYPANQRYQPLDQAGTASVRDRATTVIWQQGFSPQPLTWAEAQTYCAALPGQFRLPGAKELLSLVDFSIMADVPIDLTAFPGTPFAAFWTATPSGGTAGEAIAVDFDAYGTVRRPALTATNLARCVR